MRAQRATGVIIRAAIAALVCAVVLASATEPVRAQSNQSLEDRIGDQKKELDRIKSEIDAHRAESKKLQKQERAVIKRLSTLDKEIDLSRQFLNNLSTQERLMTERVDSLRVRIDYEDSKLTEKKAILGKRVRQLYKRDPNHRWDIVLGSSDLQQVVRRYKYSRLIAEHDAALIEQIRDRKLTFETESAAITESLADISMVRTSREEEAQKLEGSKRKRQTMLAQIRNEKGEHAEAIKELERAQEEMKNLMGRLEERRLELERQGVISEGDFVKLKGKMIRPVEGKVVRGFGQQKHPKYGTVTFNNGVDIGASAGAPISAVAPGVVEFVDWIDGYGKCIILNHGGGYYTLYAHVSATFIAQNQKVAHGEVIAEVGDTGSINGYECHFEIRKSKQALNPFDWFAK
jgi:septal ring factor EnvC (AmiA/AmiB activator)